LRRFLSITCIIIFQNLFGQTETIKIAKDTAFDITDFVNFCKSDTAKRFSFIKNKYFKYSDLLTGIKVMNCSDKADNPPYTLVNTNFVMNYCMWNTGKVYKVELSILNRKFLNKSIVTDQLYLLGFTAEDLGTKKRIHTTRFIWIDKKRRYPDRYVVVRSRKKKITSVEFF
jgi:hypothetical protein